MWFFPDRLRSGLLAAWVALMLGLVTSTASACPMCKAAAETDTRVPQAYMYSILFMISMPATLFAGFTFGFYRLWKKQQLLMQDPDEPGSLDGAIE